MQIPQRPSTWKNKWRMDWLEKYLEAIYNEFMKSFLVLFLLFGISLQGFACKIIPSPSYYKRIEAKLKEKVGDYPRFKKYKIYKADPYALTVTLHRKERKCKRIYFGAKTPFAGSCAVKYNAISIGSCQREPGPCDSCETQSGTQTQTGTIIDF